MRKRKCKRCGYTDHTKSVQHNGTHIMVRETCHQCGLIYRRRFRDKPKSTTPARKFIVDVQPVVVYAGRVLVIDLEEAS